MCLGTDSVLCCWERREGGVGGNYHIKGKEFKINLISQSPPPRGLQWACSVLLWHTRRVQSEWNRDEERGRGPDRGNQLAPNQVELVWEGSHGMSHFVRESCEAISMLLVLFVYVWSSTNDLYCQSCICICSSLPVFFPHCLTLWPNGVIRTQEHVLTLSKHTTPANCTSWHVFKRRKEKLCECGHH